MKVTDRQTANCESDYCIEYPSGTFLWMKDNRIVNNKNMLAPYEVNELLDYLTTTQREYEHMYKRLCK